MRVGANTFGSPNGKKRLITSNQSTNDIIREIQACHKIYGPEYDKGSKHFWAGDAESTAKGLFDFLKKNVDRKTEPIDVQTSTSPAALLHRGHGDCKHYASFVAGVADSLRRAGHPIEVFYRFASYKPGKDYHHVFAVILDEDGTEYWVDPVLPSFNYRGKKPVKHTDRSPGTAAIGSLYRLSGIDDAGQVGLFRGKKFKAEKAAAKAAGKSTKDFRKERRAKRKDEGKGFFRKVGGAVKKVSLAPSRNSYLLLLKMNLFRMASKMKARMNQNPEFKDKLAKRWKQLGGNPNQLFKDIDRGVKVWNRRHKDKQISGHEANASDVMYGLNKYGWAYDNFYLDDLGFCVDCSGKKPVNTIGYIGVAPAIGAGAIIAAASAIIAALAPLLKKEGIDTSNMKSEAAAVEQDMYQEEAAEAVQEETQAYQDTEGGDYDEYAPEMTDPDLMDVYDDPAVEEEYYGMSGVTGEDIETAGKGASALVSLFKRSPEKKAAAQARKAKKRAAKGKAATGPKKVKGKVKTVIKAIPLRGKVLPSGARVIEHGTPVWDGAVRASHGQGGQKGLTIHQGPEGGQGVTDWLNNAGQWVKDNPGTAMAAGAGLLILTGTIPLGGKKRRR